ncbi:non-ribosomal peptide synthetase [Paenibacillus sp. P32E]|uniref:non-ribosomal peptide synthetase n=1 Tax=Paenibacillus sp. P32E TaxID=1349434 RepID=UPI00093D3B67|nr:non-ribosomal peptide synthetase [Paenibacillus sp. P32E]OKP94747.1 hypothetical protein A3848_01880 [Paenibacillus sp. P32E]
MSFPVYYGLTHAQKRIWYEEQLSPSTSIYNIGGAVFLRGEIDLVALEKAIQLAVRMNEGLRLRFELHNGEVRQYVEEHREEALPYFHFEKLEDDKKSIEQFMVNESAKPFSILEDRLFYFTLFTIEGGTGGYFIKMHHIIADGWSCEILTNQIAELYLALLNGQPAHEMFENRYTVYINQEQNYLQSDRFQRDKRFWNTKYADLPSKLPFRSMDDPKGRRMTFFMDQPQFMKVKKMASDTNCSINSIYIALLMIYLYKTTFERDVIIGSPALNRMSRIEKGIFGMFTNTLPIRIRNIDGILSAYEFFKLVYTEAVSCYKHQKYPFDLLMKDINFAREHGDNRLFDICVNYYNTKFRRELGHLEVDNVEFYNGRQSYSLQMIIREWGDENTATIEYDYKEKNYSGSDIAALHDQLNSLIDQITENPYELVGKLTLLSKTKMDKLFDSSHRAQDAKLPNTNVIQLFEKQAAETPDRIAVILNNRWLTYKELNEEVDRLAGYLMKCNIAHGDLVGLVTVHSIESIVGILGVMKAGAAYVPIDTDSPRERIELILADSDISVVLVNEDRYKINPMKVDITVDLREADTWSKENTCDPDIAEHMLDGTAYVIYTSGSTGKPKGVVIDHKALLNYILWAKNTYVKSEIEVFSLFTSLAFDLTVTSIFTPLVSGGQIIVYPPVAEEHVLYKILRENKSTVIKLTPSHLSLIAHQNYIAAGVKRFIVGGEDLKVSLAQTIMSSFGHDVEIYNEYGPTEATVGCMIHKFDPACSEEVSVPIGMSIDNIRVYVLDPDLMPVPQGVTGEIYIAGSGLAKEYLNLPDVTFKSFIHHPHLNERLYKTGDLAHTSPNGILFYEGRADQVVKIRGNRVDLNEIEYHLLNHPAIREAIVTEIKSPTGNSHLCAYLVAETSIQDNDLASYLAMKLPAYMVPDYFMPLRQIPLTINGKVDIRDLPKPVMKGDQQNHVDGRNEIEVALVETIQETLNLVRIGINDNFFHLGGDSISAIQISSRMKSLGFTITAAEILKSPIIGEMSLSVRRAYKVIGSRDEISGILPQTPPIMWFKSLQLNHEEHYHQSIMISISPTVTLHELILCWNVIIRHHDALRLNYDSNNGLFFNKDHLIHQQSIERYDLSSLAPDRQAEYVIEMATKMKSETQLNRDLLVQACLFELGEQGNHLLLTAHHLVMDSVSWRIILSHLYMLLKQLREGRELELPFKTSSYKAWAEDLYLQSQVMPDNELDYWLDSAGRLFKYPYAIEAESSTDEAYTLYTEVPEGITSNLLTNANIAYNTQTKELLLLALMRTIRELTSMQAITLELEGHGREGVPQLDLTETVGWFTSFYPLHADLTSNELDEQIKEVKELVRRIPHNGRNYGIYKYICGMVQESESDVIRFNYLGEFSKAVDNEYFQIVFEETGVESSRANKLSSLIELNCLVVSDKLKIQITYNQNRLTTEHMERFMEAFLEHIKSIAEHCRTTEELEFTSSDFELAGLSTEELNQLFQL